MWKKKKKKRKPDKVDPEIEALPDTLAIKFIDVNQASLAKWFVYIYFLILRGLDALQMMSSDGPDEVKREIEILQRVNGSGHQNITRIFRSEVDRSIYYTAKVSIA